VARFKSVLDRGGTLVDGQPLGNMRVFVFTGIPPLKASSVSAEQAGSEIHMVEGLFGIDKLVDGLMADGFSCKIMADSPRYLFRA
jgi:hypothetical protein